MVIFHSYVSMLVYQRLPTRSRHVFRKNLMPIPSLNLWTWGFALVKKNRRGSHLNRSTSQILKKLPHMVWHGTWIGFFQRWYGIDSSLADENRGVWRDPFNNREMMIDGTPNRPLYFYQKDIIVIWYIQNVHFHHPDHPQFYHYSAGWYNGMAWYGSPSLGCVKATLVVKSTVFVNPLFAFRLETFFF